MQLLCLLHLLSTFHMVPIWERLLYLFLSLACDIILSWGIKYAPYQQAVVPFNCLPEGSILNQHCLRTVDLLLRHRSLHRIRLFFFSCVITMQNSRNSGCFPPPQELSHPLPGNSHRYASQSGSPCCCLSAPS